MLGQIALLFLAHMTGDFYAAFFGPLVPALTEKLGLTLSMTGALAAIYALTSNFLQPVIGLLTDRAGRQRLVVAGVLCAALGMSTIGFAGNFVTLCIILAIGGLGVGFYHPCGAALAGAIAGRRRSTAISLYTAGGNVGVALAPMIVPVVAAEDMERLAYLAIPGVVVAALLWGFLRRDPARPVSDTSAHPIRLGRAFTKLSGLCLHVVLRSVAVSAYFVLLPLYGTLRGLTKIEGGRLLSLFILAGTVGALAGGYLTDRLPRRPLVVLTEIGAGICLVLAPATTGMAFFATLSLGAFLAYAAMPLQIVMAQERVPRTEGAASGIVMGFAFGVSNLLLMPLGWLADRWTEITASKLSGVTLELRIAAAFLLAAGALAVFLKSAPRKAAEGEA